MPVSPRTLVGDLIQMLGLEGSPLSARDMVHRLNHGSHYTKNQVNTCLYANTPLFRQLPGSRWTLSPRGKERLLVRSMTAEEAPPGSSNPDSPQINQIYFRDEDQWVPIPDWASFLIRVGVSAAQAGNSTEHPVIALTLPTASFAASFVALGVMLQLARSRPKGPGDSAHFKFLQALPNGTPVSLRDGLRCKVGILRGAEYLDGAWRLRVQIESEAGSGLSYLLPISQSHRIQLVDGVAELPIHNTGKAMIGGEGFAAAVLGGTVIFDHAGQDSNDCLLVGRVAALRAEVLAEDFAVNANSRRRVGSLQEILRTKKFGKSGQHHRSHVASSSVRTTDQIPIDEEGVVVYSDATAFLKTHHLWPSHRTIVTLDRTDRLAIEAAGAINDEYVRRSNDMNPIKGVALPRGVEVLSFSVRP